MENLFEISQKKGIKTLCELGKFINGRKLKTIPPKSGQVASGHNYKPRFKVDGINKSLWDNYTSNFGSTQVIGGVSGTNYQICKDTTKGNSTGIHLYELTLDEETKTDLESEVKAITDKYKKEIKELKSKIKVLNDNGLDVYDEKLIKMIKAMGDLEFKEGSTTNKVDLAKLLLNID